MKDIQIVFNQLQCYMDIFLNVWNFFLPKIRVKKLWLVIQIRPAKLKIAIYDYFLAKNVLFFTKEKISSRLEPNLEKGN